MDSLILTFDNEQYKKYVSLLDCPNAPLHFKTDFEVVAKTPRDVLPHCLSEIESICEELLKFNKSDSVFHKQMDGEAVRELIPAYFEAVRKLENISLTLYRAAGECKAVARELDKLTFEVYGEYRRFLPYKAALLEVAERRAQIEDIESALRESASNLERQKKELCERFEKTESLCEHFLPEFFEETRLASDSPKFQNFNDKQFFTAISALSIKIQNLK